VTRHFGHYNRYYMGYGLEGCTVMGIAGILRYLWVYRGNGVEHGGNTAGMEQDQCCNYWNSQYNLNTIEIVMNYLTDYLK